jgi:hypothetical protein
MGARRRALRTDADTGQSRLLANATGSYNGGSYQLVTFQYTSNGTTDAAVQGHDVALSFVGATTSANIDNVMVRVDSPVGPLDHFVISPINPPQTVGTPITGITLTAKDASSNTVTGFTGTVTFGGTGGFYGSSANFVTGVLSNASVTPTVAGGNLTLTVSDGASPTPHTGSTTIATIQSAYDAWSGGETFDDDVNGDGVGSGVAWLLGAANPNANTAGLLPAVSRNNGNLVLTFRCLNAANRGGAALNVQHSNNLGASEPWASAAVPETSGPVSGVNFTITPDGDFNNVVATIPDTEATGGKLFGRLKAEAGQ